MFRESCSHASLIKVYILAPWNHSLTPKLFLFFREGCTTSTVAWGLFMDLCSGITLDDVCIIICTRNWTEESHIIGKHLISDTIISDLKSINTHKFTVPEHSLMNYLLSQRRIYSSNVKFLLKWPSNAWSNEYIVFLMGLEPIPDLF